MDSNNGKKNNKITVIVLIESGRETDTGHVFPRSIYRMASVSLVLGQSTKPLALAVKVK